MVEILLDTLIDSAKMLPFLFGAYFLLEYIEHRAGHLLSDKLLSLGPLAPVGGAIISCVPQCGFSVAAANLFSGRLITTGTLLAVFISTSDEALPILIASGQSFYLIMQILLFKVLIGIIAGILIDLFIKKKFSVNEVKGPSHGDCHHTSSFWGIFFTALKHTLYIALFIFFFLFAINILISFIGTSNLSSFLMTGQLLQPILAALIGLIPNCLPSVLLTQLYISGALSFGSLIAGLITSAGLGPIFLFRSNKNLKQNLMILLLLYIIGTSVGMLLQILL